MRGGRPSKKGKVFSGGLTRPVSFGRSRFESTRRAHRFPRTDRHLYLPLPRVGRAEHRAAFPAPESSPLAALSFAACLSSLRRLAAPARPACFPFFRFAELLRRFLWRRRGFEAVGDLAGDGFGPGGGLRHDRVVEPVNQHQESLRSGNVIPRPARFLGGEGVQFLHRGIREPECDVPGLRFSSWLTSRFFAHATQCSTLCQRYVASQESRTNSGDSSIPGKFHAEQGRVFLRKSAITWNPWRPQVVYIQ